MSLHVLGVLAVGLMMAATFVQRGQVESDFHVGTRFGLFLASWLLAFVWVGWMLMRAIA